MVRFGIWNSSTMLLNQFATQEPYPLHCLDRILTNRSACCFTTQKIPASGCFTMTFLVEWASWSQRIRALKPTSNCVWGANPCPLSTTHSDGDRYCKDQWDSQRVQARKGMKGLVVWCLRMIFSLGCWIKSIQNTHQEKQLKTFHD